MTTAEQHQPVILNRSPGLWLASGVSAVAVGALSGTACAGVRFWLHLLQWIFVQHTGTLPAAAASLSPVRRFLTPALGAILATVTLWAVQRWSLAGPFVEYVDAIRRRNGQIPFRSTFWRTVASSFSVSTGAAIGREGSMIQFAAAVTAWAGERFPLHSISLKRQVAFGAAAAVAAAYQAPIAGLFFASEVIWGEWRWAEGPLLALASAAGWLASRELLGAGPLFKVSTPIGFSSRELWLLLLAAALGAAAPAYQKLLRSLKQTSAWPAALVWSGLIVGALSLLQPAVWGNGDAALTAILQNAPPKSILFVLLLRLLATTVCVGAGTVGGVFTPTLFAGAAMGLMAGHLLDMRQATLFAIVGLSTLLAGVTHAPFMASFMAVELTGQWRLWPVLLVLNLIAYLIARLISPRALYTIATQAPTRRD